MIIVSQNLTNYEVPIPNDAIFRINLAWVNNLDELKELLTKHSSHRIFLDLPINRTKLPNNKYSLEEIIPIINQFENIEFFAVSNVEGIEDIKQYVELIPKNIIIVPKIESPKGVNNIKEITDGLNGSQKILMLDHDDLYSNLIKNNEPASKFKNYLEDLVNYCNKNNIIILRTIGVIFSDSEKRITQYIG